MKSSEKNWKLTVPLKIFFGSFLLFIVACSGPRQITRRPVTLDGITTSEIVRRNRDNGSGLRYIRSIATINLESPRSANQFGSQIAIRCPDSVYIKIEGILGIDGVKASLNRETFLVYNIINKYVVTGKTSADAIRKTFDYDVSFEEMMDLLTGLPKLHESDIPGMSDLAADGSYYIMTLSTPAGKQKIQIDPFANFAISKIEYFDLDGQVVMEKEFSRFEEINGVFFPRYVRVLRPREKDLLSLFFEARTINKPFSSALFTIRYPRDIDIIKK